MIQKQTQSGGLVRDYVSCILKSSVGKHSGKLLLYADGLATMKKKGIKAMIRDLKGRYHTSTISRTLKREHIMLERFKKDHIMRDVKFDRRRNYFFILDDTPVKRYGRKIFGSGLNHDGSSKSRIWSNNLVTFLLALKKGR